MTPKDHIAKVQNIIMTAMGRGMFNNDDMREALTHLTELEKAQEWQTIDTAPNKEGFYWAKWRIKDAGTEDENEPCSDTWEVVQVFENCNDEKSDEYLRVFVGGVSRSQSLENFYWGAKITQPPRIVPDEGEEK